MRLLIRMTNMQPNFEIIAEDDKRVVAEVICKQPIGPDDPGPWQDKQAERLAMLLRTAPELLAAIEPEWDGPGFLLWIAETIQKGRCEIFTEANAIVLRRMCDKMCEAVKQTGYHL